MVSTAPMDPVWILDYWNKSSTTYQPSRHQLASASVAVVVFVTVLVSFMAAIWLGYHGRRIVCAVVWAMLYTQDNMVLRGCGFHLLLYILYMYSARKRSMKHPSYEDDDVGILSVLHYHWGSACRNIPNLNVWWHHPTLHRSNKGREK